MKKLVSMLFMGLLALMLAGCCLLDGIRLPDRDTRTAVFDPDPAGGDGGLEFREQGEASRSGAEPEQDDQRSG